MSRETKTPDEKKLEKDLCYRIDSGPEGLKSIRIATSTGTRSLLDLVGEYRPTFLNRNILEDTSDWNTSKGLSVDLFNGITPDIVLRSPLTGENRIIIEVKKTSPFTHIDPDASQVVRYFLHLLATTNKRQEKDIKRAVLLAAPTSWFSNEKVASPWNYFVDHYGALARQWEIEIGSIVLDETGS
jgi:hypothetical protein